MQTVSSDQLRGASDPQEELQQRLPAAPAGETAGSVLAAQAVAVIQARTAMAVARPRDLDVVRQKLLKECRRPGFADAAIYHKPIGDGVEGLSIRFVEAALRCMQNVSTDVFVIFDDDDKRILRVVVSDLENNVSYTGDITIAKTIERRGHSEYDLVLKKRLNSKGKTVYLLRADDEQILDKVNALTSKAMRTLGLRVIPGDIADECEQLCYKIRNDKAAKDPEGERLRIIDGFGSLGVAVEQLKAYLGHDGTTLSPKELSTLRGLYVALRDEETTWLEIMENRKVTPPPKQPQPKQQEKPPEAEKKTDLSTQQQAVARMQTASALESQQKESELAQGRAALAEGRTEEIRQQIEADRGAEIERRQAASAAKPAAPLDDEFDMSGQGYDPADDSGTDGRPTFEELLRKIKEAKSAKYISESVIPMITEIPNANHQRSLLASATNKIKSLQAPPAKPADNIE